ncbi:MAG: peptide chain release factor N(5)-glutamine methyltransferase [Chloroflexi bacterium]|nr:peptide chain release factor N(5)-glutamine methyltransferase [Chloroflexota bacterium]
MTLTIGQALADARKRLAGAGSEESSLEADLLVAGVLGWDRARLYACLDAPFPAGRRRTLERFLLRRLRREPLPYILGRQEFYGLDFQVARGVLIPRPETETLVEQALALARARASPVAIADVGAGSGAIAVSLAAHLPQATLYATDTSRRALAVARANAQRHGVLERIVFLAGSLLSPLPGPVDIIAANLPYLPSSRIPTLAPEVSRYEPRRALDGGPDGLRLARRLLKQAPKYLKGSGMILLELDPEQMDSASATAKRVFPDAVLRRVKDLAGRERVLVVEC